jgi:hypothetical protein
LDRKFLTSFLFSAVRKKRPENFVLITLDLDRGENELRIEFKDESDQNQDNFLGRIDRSEFSPVDKTAVLVLFLREETLSALRKRVKGLFSRKHTGPKQWGTDSEPALFPGT